jgi:hypothetical protein
MDPYLEGTRWSGFHHDLATEIKRQLIPRLLPRYYADTSTFFLVDEGEEVEIRQSLYPDIAVAENISGESPGQVTVMAAAPVQTKLILPHRVPLSQVEIRDLENRLLVTTIEFLSPANKRGQGRKQYLHKRLQILRSKVHLIELDWLRRGQRLPWSGQLPPASYYVYLSRGNRRSVIDVWPIKPAQLLPVIPVPLLNGDPDVPLDLQQAFSAVYDASRYDRLLNYRQDPEVPLTATEMAWLDKLLKEKGYR